MILDKVIEQLKEHEGFRGEVYQCSEGFATVGYGCKMPITRPEATLLLRHRLMVKEEELKRLEPRYMKAKDEVKEIVLNLAYNIGVGGLLKFRKMWKALENHDYKEAGLQILDSKYAKQVPNRALDLSNRMAEIKDKL